MSKLTNTLRAFVRDENGLELPEYAVMAALIISAIVAAIVALSGAITARFNDVTGVINGSLVPGGAAGG